MVRKASGAGKPVSAPAITGWAAFRTGEYSELVSPTMQILPEGSRATALAESSSPPPRKVESIKPEPAAFITVRNPSVFPASGSIFPLLYRLWRGFWRGKLDEGGVG